MKILVVYDTKYGNTKLVAETILEGLKRVEGIETAIHDIEKLKLDELPDFDVVLIGSPNHFGRPVRGINRFIDRLGELDTRGKKAAVFDTYLGGDFNKAVLKMESRIKDKAPDLELISTGLSIKVEGTKGPITEGELPKCRDFGTKIAGKFE
jgi:flavorubredoxin